MSSRELVVEQLIGKRIHAQLGVWPYGFSREGILETVLPCKTENTVSLLKKYYGVDKKHPMFMRLIGACPSVARAILLRVNGEYAVFPIIRGFTCYEL